MGISLEELVKDIRYLGDMVDYYLQCIGNTDEKTKENLHELINELELQLRDINE